MTLSKEQLVLLKEELDNLLEAQDTDLVAFVRDGAWSKNEPEKIGGHTYQFIHYGSTDGIDVETRDGCTTEFIFEIDGNLYAMYGYYSSYGDSEIDQTDLTPVELKTREERYYAEVKAA